MFAPLLKTAAGRLVVAAALFGLFGCSQRQSADRQNAAIGDAKRGARLIAARGCGSCHEIPGIKGADGYVGPPLQRWNERGYISGQLPNTPQNTVRWLYETHAVAPDTAMPELGLSRTDASDIAAYLWSAGRHRS